MHICHVITRLIVGGAQENTILTCRGLVERGHRVTLVAGPQTGPEGTLWAQASKTGCELITAQSLRREVGPLSDWRARRELRKIFERIQPDVVHTHSSKAGILGRFAAARAGVPVIVHTIHGMSFNRTQPLFVRTLYRWLERRAARYTTAFVSVADAMTDQAVAAGIAPRHRFVTIRSGIEIDRFVPCSESRERFRRQWGVTNDEIVVGTIARLFENKGYEDIIAAMPGAVMREPRLRFVWIGGGANRARYERKLEALGLRDRVHLVGLIEPDQVACQLNGFDIVLHASRWEGLPRAVVQGLLTGVPAISLDNDGAPEVVIPGETGILVPFGDIKRLADAIVTLAADADMRRALGDRGRIRCTRMFDCREMVAQLDRLYRELPSLNP
jgi:glycosyltransferase involved in cell wall biosynthesis